MSVHILFTHSKPMGLRKNPHIQSMCTVFTSHTTYVNICSGHHALPGSFICSHTVHTPDLFTHFSGGELA